MRICRACKKQFDAEGSKTDQAFCPDDNRALDRIYYMAKSLGAEALSWLSEVRRDDAKVSKMLQNYWDRVGGKSKWKGKAPVGVKWSLNEYIESVKVTTGVEKRAPGKMMWEKEFFEYASAAAGGKMTDEESAAVWNSWVVKYQSNPKDPSITWDLDGPKKAPLQFRVALGKFVDFTQKYEHEKKIEQHLKLKKDIPQGELHKYRLKAMTGHEEIGASGQGKVDFAELGRQMGQESLSHAEGTFCSDLQRFGSSSALQDLCPDAEEADDDEEEEDVVDSENGENKGKEKGGGGTDKKQTQHSRCGLIATPRSPRPGA